MDLGAILLPASTAERSPAVPADTAPRTTVRIPIPPVHGVSTVIPSIDAQKPAPAAARPLLTMRIIAILMAHGQKRTIRSTSARKPAPLAAIPAKNMQTTEIPTQMVSATIAVLLSA